MINRYAIPEVTDLWSQTNKYKTWLQVELLALNGWVKAGVIPEKDYEAIKNKAIIDPELIAQTELETKHDVVAFIWATTAKLGAAGRWFHFGLTSTDVVDTAQNYLIKQSNLLVEQATNKLLTVLKTKAYQYQSITIMGRTHGIYAEPTSLGLKFASWYAEMNRQLNRFQAARTRIEVAKISGAVGNFAHVQPIVETTVATGLGLGLDPITTQITSRDRHLELMLCFVNFASTLEKIATELRLWQRSEIDEFREGFGQDQTGSSAMPHKANPISAENICGLARLIRSNALPAAENNILWQERDISHSSNERIIIPDTFHLIVYTLNRLTKLLTNLQINTVAILNHIKASQERYACQKIMLLLIANHKWTRKEAYKYVQKAAQQSIVKNQQLSTILTEQKIDSYLTHSELISCFDLKTYTKNTELIFNRVFANKLK